MPLRRARIFRRIELVNAKAVARVEGPGRNAAASLSPQVDGARFTAVTRFSLLKTKGYYRARAQAEAHAPMVFCAMHGLAALRRDRRGSSPEADVPQQLSAAA